MKGLMVYMWLPLSCKGFSSSPIMKAWSRRRTAHPLPWWNTGRRGPMVFIASETQPSTSEADAAILKKIESEIEKENRRREKAMQEIWQMEERLSSLEKKKRQYLEGLQIGLPRNKNFSETAVRSAVKAFTWRLIGGSVTFLTSLRFSGSMSTALSIVGSDFFSKALTMFIGERLMNKSQAGRKGGSDAAGRSLAKAIIWRLFAICNTLVMAVFIAKDLKMASKIAGFDSVFKTALMFGFERLWANIEWGKEYIIEFSI